MSTCTPNFVGLNSPIFFDARKVTFDDKHRQLRFKIGSQHDLVVSVFVNVLKIVDPMSYTIKDLKCAAKKSFCKHFRLKPVPYTPVALSTSLSAAELEAAVPRGGAFLASEARHHLAVRVEAVGQSSKCVLCYFFKAEPRPGGLIFTVEEAYADLGQRSYRLLDIFGLNAMHAVSTGSPLECCIICAASNATVVIIPCRHLCICPECSLLFNQLADLSKRICPLCREPMTAFLRLKKLEGLSSADSLPAISSSNTI